ncbi:S9 family peptidase [Maritalea sp.]|jgi:oligopeptidase B|uniref:S9 family peptidase n=1 Tax=Maritalea sp. TaxID=2003361 RepID=UPI0039E2EDC3
MGTSTPPIAETRPHFSEHHGHKRNDVYHWLRDENWQKVMHDPSVLREDIRTYLDAENAHFEGFMGDHEKLKDTIYNEIRGRIKEDDTSVPFKHGAYAYFSRTLEGKQYSQVCRTDRDGGNEVVLIDNNVEAGDGYFRSGGASHSPDHKLLAWSCDRKGSEYFTVFVRDLETGKELSDQIINTSGGTVWAADSQSFFYIIQDENHRPHKVFQHTLGTDAAKDRLVYEEKDAGFFLGLHKTSSGNLILIDANDHETSEIRYIDAHNANSDPVLISARVEGREYGVEDDGETLYIVTNADGAIDFKMVTAPLASPSADNWTDLIPHRPGILMQGYFLKKGYLVRKEQFEGLPRIIVRDLANGTEEAISFDEEAYTLSVAGGYEYESSELRYYYSSPTTPSQVFDYDLKTKARTLRKTQEIPSGHDPKNYVTRRLFATSHDGEQVPVTILHRADLKLDGSAPLLLYGYGSYGMSMPAGFSENNLSLVDRGMVYAIAHIRGGMEKGYSWYTNGKREHKTNTFDDFVASANMLIEKGYTSKGKIAAMGGSAGGMLMGAMANKAPELFGSIIALVPFVDVLNTMLDDTLPLTPPEWPEWGNPIESKEDYERIAAYSPYDNVVPQNYPSMFVMAGLTDPRVTYWEPAKWVAKLRVTKTDSNPLILKTHMGAGHGGMSGRFERIKEVAMAYVFALETTK